MKAFLLAAGLGTRLRPITQKTPKCLLRVDGEPLLDIWLDALRQAGIDEVLVNTHYLADAVRRHVAQRTHPPRVRTFFEADLLGSAGTLLANREWVEGEELFLACYADNLTDFDLSSLVEFHREGNEIATLAVFRAQNPSSCGIVELDGDRRVIGFVEKPPRPSSNLANAGMYVFDPQVLDEIDGGMPRDIGYDLLPRLIGKARAMLVEGYFRDIGTPESYQAAKRDWHMRVTR